MTDIIEQCARAIAKLDNPEFEADNDYRKRVKVIIATLSANIDEGAIESAAKTYWEKRNSKAEFTDMLTSVIQAYLTRL